MVAGPILVRSTNHPSDTGSEHRQYKTSKIQIGYMWYRKGVWKHYEKNILATDKVTASFLQGYMKQMMFSRSYCSVLDVFDLNKYQVIRNAGKVQVALREKRGKPFIFVAGRN